MDAYGLQDENLLPDHFHTKDSSSLSESAPSGTCPMVVPLLPSSHLPQVASMAEFDPDQFRADESDESSDESVRLLSRMSILRLFRP